MSTDDNTVYIYLISAPGDSFCQHLCTVLLLIQLKLQMFDFVLQVETNTTNSTTNIRHQTLSTQDVEMWRWNAHLQAADLSWTVVLCGTLSLYLTLQVFEAVGEQLFI